MLGHMSSDGKKILVVVLALDTDPWRRIQDEGQKSTWAKFPEVPVFWLHGRNGGSSRFLVRSLARVLWGRALYSFHTASGRWASNRRVRIVGDRIETNTPETYLMTNAKTVAAFRHVLGTKDFDYVLRTNTSSYVNLAMLLQFIQDLPDEKYYGGTLWEKNGLTYVTGTSILLSRDLVQHAAYDPDWEFGLIDDLALGRSMSRLGISPRPIPRVDVGTPDALSGLTKETAASSFVIRCRGTHTRLHDITAMHRVHELLGRD
jgi:hypothetical protein